MPAEASSKTVCVVPGCGHDSKSGFNFFRVPITGTNVYQKWTKFMRLSGNRTEKICASHFEDSDFRSHSRIMLRQDAVPSLRLPVVEPFFKTTGFCCVSGCKSKGSGILTPFPMSQHYKSRWMAILKMPTGTATSWMRICERHFTTKSFVTVNSVYLKSNAIPSKRIRRITQNPRVRPQSSIAQDPESETVQSSDKSSDKPSDKPSEKPRSHRMCSVFKCSSRAGKEIFLHSFPPKSDARYQSWIHNLKQGKTPSKNYKVCSRHFTPFDYKKGTKRLHDSAIPTLNLPKSTISANSSPVTQRSHRRAKQDDDAAATVVENDNYTLICSQLLKNDSRRVGVTSAEDDQEIDSFDISGSTGTEPTSIRELGENPGSDQVVEQGTVSEIIEPKVKPRVSNFFSDLLINDQAVNVLTGIESLELLEQICICCKILEDNVYPNKHAMHCTDRVILVLCKLKQNLSFSALAIFFGVHNSTISRYFSYTMHVLAEVLSTFVEFTPKEEIVQNIPLCFRGKFFNVTLVLDCTEIPLCTLNCLNCRISTYSQYKSRYTAKFLIGVTPAGLISLCGKAYSGKASDKFIFNDEHVIDLLTPHVDEVMTDKGFSIEKELTAKGITLHIPPFLRDSKLSASDAEENEEIAKARIHVERIIARLKIFSILHDTVDHYIVGHLDEIMTVICALVNLSKPILKDDKF